MITNGRGNYPVGPGAVAWPVYVSLPVRGAGQPEPGGVRGGGSAGWDAEFGQHGGDLMINGPAGEDQLGGDFSVAVPGADQVEHLTLAAGQPERIGPGRGP